MNHGSVTHRRFPSPHDRGEVVIPSSRRPAKKRDQPLPGTKKLHVPALPPADPAIARRTLNHYEHDGKAKICGRVAFAAACAMVGLIIVILVMDAVAPERNDDVLFVLIVACVLVANLFGLMSQVFSHGRCTLGDRPGVVVSAGDLFDLLDRTLTFNTHVKRGLHRFAIPFSLIVAGLLPWLGGCATLVADRHTYASEAASPAVVVNGATVRVQVRPQGTESGSYALSAMVVTAAKATFDGPFRWRVDASGEPGRHEWVQVHRIRTRTSASGRDEWYPARHLGARALFRKRGEDFRASYEIPGLLNVKPREDGALDVFVDLTVMADGKAERRVAKFRMEPAHKRSDEFVFLPAEVISHIGKPVEDWGDGEWD